MPNLNDLKPGIHRGLWRFAMQHDGLEFEYHADGTVTVLESWNGEGPEMREHCTTMNQLRAALGY